MRVPLHTPPFLSAAQKRARIAGNRVNHTYIAELGDLDLAADVLQVVDVVVELLELVPLLHEPLVVARERL